MIALQTVMPESPKHQTQMVMVPISRAMGYPPQLVQVAKPGPINAVYKPLQVDIPQSSGNGGYTRLTNEQVHVSLVS